MGLLIGFHIDAEPAAMVWRDGHHVPVIAMVFKWRVCGPNFEDDLHRFLCHRAGTTIYRDPEQLCVGGQPTRPNPEVETTFGQMVEVGQTIGDQHRMMELQQDHARS